MNFGGDKVKTITIRVSDEFHKQLKLKMAESGTTLQDYLVKFMEADLQMEAKEKSK